MMRLRWPGTRAFSWVIALDLLAIAALCWTVVMMLAWIGTHADCTRECGQERLGVIGGMLVGGVLLGPPLVLALVAVLHRGERRRQPAARIAYGVLALAVLAVPLGMLLARAA